MVVKPKMRGFICTTAHPVGCRKSVEEDIAYVRSQSAPNGPGRVLVIGCSTGYGLACREAAAFGWDADTVGVCLERGPSGNRTGTAGWYNNLAFEQAAGGAGRQCPTIVGDAYSDEVKAQAIQAIRQLPGGQVDLVVYSLAAPKRVHPKTGVTHSSVIKPVGAPFGGKTVDFHTGAVTQVEIAPATEEELAATVQVMGGEDWLFWMQALKDAGVLARGAGTVAFSYLGPVITHAVYKDGTIGHAKEDLEVRCNQINALLGELEGRAFVSVNKALVTQASAAIPVVPLYISLLYRTMKDKGTHENCIQQMVRMFQRMYGEGAAWDTIPVDEAGRIRMDDWEMEPDVQDQVAGLWENISSENIAELGDLEGYRSDFYRLFGFGVDGVDYNMDLENLE